MSEPKYKVLKKKRNKKIWKKTDVINIAEQ